ncbi:Transglutaminase-like superfamily [Actinomyces bovis]|uniref:Transglutaminase-like superfamily n=1 Tax=Actinomyces bovis TaxID=1658 RepID=A0ABY1VM12_9ACTO|nr:transglutaminase domain-containing protein [Actinomyces bovis]SPT52959.1 Transglutaminase-like superfamily [Actinomyces bovis]VEG55157.1 Transglutaminase-like superfamily [Actinomyces israelii]
MTATTPPLREPRTRRIHLGDLAVVTCLLLLAGATHGPVFGDHSGYLAATGGVLLGALVAVAAAVWRWNLLETSLGVVVVYLLGGGPLALPTTTSNRVLPTLATLQGLVVGATQAWKDLLTLTPPAATFAGPAIVPFMSGLLGSVVAITIALRSRRQGWALVPVVALALIGVAWGSQNAPWGRYLGTAAAVTALLWGAWLAQRRRSAAAAGITSAGATAATATSRLRKARATAGGVVVLALAAGVGAMGAAQLDPQGHRAVLRDHVTPPLDLSSYASPLTSYRYWMDDKKDAVLFTVEGLQKDQRLRLATLDTYDGVVMRVGDTGSGEGFHRVGSTVSDDPLPDGAEITTLSIAVKDYTGYWIPGGGELRKLEVTSPGAATIKDTLYYSSKLQTALTTRGLTKGDTYTVEAVMPKVWSDSQLTGKSFSQYAAPADKEIPEQVGQRLPEFLGEAKGGVEAIRAMAQAFSTKGFYSDGSDNLSLASHSAARLSKFLDPARLMVGDDEQYAVAMALMARQAGYPARVVLGFYPDSYTPGPVEMTGTNAHAWVEVSFSGTGWVAFDPTPPRDKKPQTELPEPKPNPRPQVIQPPVPPQHPADLNPDIDDDQQDEKKEPYNWWPWVLLGLKVVGGTLLVLAPFLTVMAIKAWRRRRRRRAKEPLARVTGAWDELVDQARDLRLNVPLTVPRAEQASAMAALNGEALKPTFRPVAKPGSMEALAQNVDGAVFSGVAPAPAEAENSWQTMEQVLRGMRKQTTRRRRLRARVSLTSLRHSSGRGVQTRPQKLAAKSVSQRRQPGSMAAKKSNAGKSNSSRFGDK